MGFSERRHVVWAMRAMAGAGVVAATACSLLDGDSGRIQLPVDESLEITPSCVAVPISSPSSQTAARGTTGDVSVPVILFAKGRDHRPAESLQVTVRVGPCEPNTPDAAGSSATSEYTGCDPSVRGLASQCASNTVPLAMSRWGTVQLAGSPSDSTCYADSTQRLSCALGPDGIARFVVRRGADVPDLVNFWVPVCVEAPKASKTFRKEFVVAFSPDAVVPKGSILIESLRTTGSVASSCDDLTCDRGKVMRLHLVSRDAGVSPAADAGTQDAGPGAVSPASTPLLARIQVTPTSQSRPVIVSGTDCSSLNTTDVVTIPAQSLLSEVFSVCASGRGGSFQLDAVLLADPSVTGTKSDGIPEALQYVGFESNASGDGRVLHYALCGGPNQVATTQTINVNPMTGITVTDGEFTIETDSSNDADAATGGPTSGNPGGYSINLIGDSHVCHRE